jgi:uroporphyrinogen decarboxylase
MDKLCRLDQDNLRRYVRHILSACVPTGRIALGSGNSIANYVPVENVFVMLEEAMYYMA